MSGMDHDAMLRPVTEADLRILERLDPGPGGDW
jgi:hypothetical protein